MTTIWARVETALAGINIPKAESVYKVATNGTYPDEYLVYFEITSNPTLNADDDEKNRGYHVQITYYNRDGLQSMPGIKAAMVAEGFIPGATRELPYNPETGHFGLALEFWYYEDQ